MEDWLRLLVLLGASVAPGRSLLCLECVSKDLQKCEGITVSCPTGSRCGRAYRLITDDKMISVEIIKSCVPSYQCDKDGIIRYSGGLMRISISCCNTDNCIPPHHKMPDDSAKVNGLTCPTCRSTDTGSCASQYNIDCAGNENKCISASTKTSVSEETVMGCTSQSICDIKDYFYHDKAFQISMEFICDGTGTSDANSPPLSCVTCVSFGSLHCNGVLQQCPLDHLCGTSFSVTSTDKKEHYMVARSCVPKNKCDTSGTMSTSGGKIYMGISCCDKDGCTPSITPPPKRPAAETPNGVKCPTCVSGSSSCEATNTMECRGDENQCLTYSAIYTSVSAASVLFRGCGVRDLCNLQGNSLTSDNFNLETNFTCTGGKVDPSSGGNMTSPSMAVIGLFLLFTASATLNIQLS